MEKLQKALQKARRMRAEVRRPALETLVLESPLPGSVPPDRDQAWADLPAFVPDRRLLTRNRIVTLTAGTAATHFDILRTKVLLAMRKNGWTRLAITSPSSSCGKTTTACNLALGFARQSDLRAMLIELDLRRPSVARQLGLTPARDITDMLSGEAQFADQAVRIGETVAIAAARRAAPDPTAVLLSHRTHDTLAAVERLYAPDMVIFDLPPILVSDDTRAFLKDVDCALLIAKAEVTTAAQIDTCEREIAEHTNMLGVVLNQCRHIADDHGYGGYGYSERPGQD